MESNQYLAHVKFNEKWQIHNLDEHLKEVAKWAGEKAAQFDEASVLWANLAGLFHDLGKYSDDFQQMIKTRSGYSDYNPEAHLEGESAAGKVNHSSAGALHALKVLGNPAGKMLAYLIAGHHAGLADWHGSLDGRLEPSPENEKLYQAALKGAIPEHILNPVDWINRLNPPAFVHPKTEAYQSMSLSFWLRMLFSCLVDADFLDTEAFMNQEKASLRNGFPDLMTLKANFDSYMVDKLKNSPATLVNQLRSKVFHSCVAKAELPTAIYTLTVPTGGGKTLTALGYALQHAIAHGKKRIIYVLPFTSILEQTAAVFHEALGSDCVIEHHSTLEMSRETAQSRLATENWDAPVILTTNVQFFESLFANRTSRCRKLHNIANSVVILDEAQQIPAEFKKPIELALRLLAQDYKTTIVLSTATQPVLDLGNTTELAPDPKRLFDALKRVHIEMPSDMKTAVKWENLAAELADHSRVLCIVNQRKDARKLFDLMPSGTYHLSALMCPAHRSEVIAEIKEKLKLDTETPVRVVSTQLVEAGVDMDFPVVYRALAGLDSIAQAAGRCNREGKLPALGQVKVFIPPTKPPIGLLRKAAQITQEMLHGQSTLEQTPAIFTQYFGLLYSAINSQDKEGIVAMLSVTDKQPHFKFKEAAQKFQLIDDALSSTVFVPYDDLASSRLMALQAEGPSRSILRKLQRYTVSVPTPVAQRMFARGDLTEVLPGLYQLESMVLYQHDVGLNVEQDVVLETGSCII